MQDLPLEWSLPSSEVSPRVGFPRPKGLPAGRHPLLSGKNLHGRANGALCPIWQLH